MLDFRRVIIIISSLLLSKYLKNNMDTGNVFITCPIWSHTTCPRSLETWYYLSFVRQKTFSRLQESKSKFSDFRPLHMHPMSVWHFNPCDSSVRVALQSVWRFSPCGTSVPIHWPQYWWNDMLSLRQRWYWRAIIVLLAW